MNVDKNDFFRQVTMRICSSLDIEVAMWRCLHYVETIMPVTGMNLHLFERDMTQLRTIAYVTRYEIEKLDRIITLPEEATAKLKDDWDEMRRVIIVNRPELNPFIQTILKIVEKPNMSIMISRLEIEGKGLGGMAMFVDGKGLYTTEHAQLFSLLHDPFAIAMSNTLKHKKVLNQRNVLVDDIQYLHKELLRISGDEIIGENFGLKSVMESVRRVAPLDIPVLILGETGVGKEVIANAIHSSSPRKNGPFIKINCGAIPETLIDSELFGHEKGAFTGAIARKRGRFERAHRGTILLDEVGELPAQAQIRFLRVLENKEIERVGGTNTVPVDIRILAATHQDLEKMLKTKQFREDLFFRLNVFPIKIPPLRDRKEDIPALAHHFVERKSSGKNFHVLPTVSHGAINRLKNYNWPGNVRELENVLERALIKHLGQNKSDTLTAEDFMLPVSNQEYDMPILFANKYNKPLKIDEAMSMHIQQVLNLTKGKIHGLRGAAELLGINPYTLRSRMNKLGIPYKKRNAQRIRF